MKSSTESFALKFYELFITFISFIFFCLVLKTPLKENPVLNWTYMLHDSRVHACNMLNVPHVRPLCTLLFTGLQFHTTAEQVWKLIQLAILNHMATFQNSVCVYEYSYILCAGVHSNHLLNASACAWSFFHLRVITAIWINYIPKWACFTALSDISFPNLLNRMRLQPLTYSGTHCLLGWNWQHCPICKLMCVVTVHLRFEGDTDREPTRKEDKIVLFFFQPVSAPFTGDPGTSCKCFLIVYFSFLSSIKDNERMIWHWGANTAGLWHRPHLQSYLLSPIKEALTVYHHQAFY